MEKLEVENNLLKKRLLKLEHDLSKRTRELDCFYAVARLVEKRNISREETLQRIVELLPLAWQYPEITCSSIIIGETQEYRTANFKRTPFIQASQVMAAGNRVGTVEIYYLEARQASDEGPFLKEERNLIDAIAEKVGKFIERAHKAPTMGEESHCIGVGLGETDKRWQFALEGTGDGLWDWNAQTNEVFFSKEWKTMLGFEEHEIGNTLDEWDRRVHPEDREYVYSEISKHFEGKLPVYVSEHRMKCKDGSYKWILDRGKIVSRTWEGKPLRVIGTHTDITERRKTEEALHESESRFRALAESIDTAIFVIQGNRYVYVNPTYTEKTGYTMEDLLYMDCWDLVSPEMRELIRTRARDISCQDKESGPLREDLKYITKSGQERFVSLGARLIEFQGKPAILCSAIDITERRRMEDALKKSEKKYRNIFEHAIEGMYQSTPDGRFISVNPAMAKICGYSSPEEMLGEIKDIGRQLYVNPKERLRFKRKLSQHGSVENFEHQIYRKDGIPIWIRTNALAVHDSQGSILYYQGAYEDITSRKQAEDDLKAAHRELGDIIEFLPDATFVVDRERKVVAWNKATEEMTGVKKEDMIGKGDYAYGIPFYGEPRPILIDLVFERDEEKDKNYDYVTKQGDILVAEVFVPGAKQGKGAYLSGRASPLFDPKGNVVGAIESIMDITIRKDLEAQLLQSQKMEAIGTLSGGIAHDFNNILAAIIGFTEMALDNIPADSPAHRHLDLVLTSSLRGRDLVKQILTFSRKTARKKEPVLLSPLVSEMSKLLRASLPATIKVTVHMDEEELTVFANPSELQQIILNLTTNAAYAMKDTGGELDITLINTEIVPGDAAAAPELAPGHYAELTVKDTGIGMDAEVMARIFEPFFTTKEPGQGTGMGLAVVYGVVKSLNGGITVKSTPGSGSTFHVFLPRIITNSIRQSAVQEIPRGSERILFIDDEEVLVELVKDMLEKLGYTVTVMTDSVEALEVFSENPSKFDLVFTDQTMPELTGLDLAEKILKIRADIPIILTSGHNDSTLAEKSKSMGISGFLMKPPSRHEMATTVRRALDLQPES